jgi:hypothetical protein
MSADSRSHFAEMVLARLAEILDRLSRLELRISDLGDEIDELDRTRRPFGDGTRMRPRRRR